MIWFLLGLTVGGTLGMFAMALLVAARAEDPPSMIGDRLDHYGRRE